MEPSGRNRWQPLAMVQAARTAETRQKRCRSCDRLPRTRRATRTTVPNARVHEIPGAGHAAPLTHPEALAKALTEFFTPARQPA
jgi:hypothetical protein